MGYFVTIVSIAGVICPLLVSAMLGPAPIAHQHVSFILILNCCIPDLIAAVCFYMAGFDY